ncbi:MAG: IS66 family insertion sequence element accessory protein TnpB, partial [bacterium]|nr:IS66 family insertion sequence element accessory protein TnpB [bacterium]
DGLQALVRQHLGDDPLSGRWYVFINRRRTLCKVLCFEAGGFCIWAKRLEKGLFASLSCGRLIRGSGRLASRTSQDVRPSVERHSGGP